MFARNIKRCFSSDFAHKQVSSGFSKKYGDQFERIFGNKNATQQTPQKPKTDIPKPSSK